MSPDRTQLHDPEGREGAVIHASCVGFAGRAVLIRGASGTGKSALALQLIGLGADLVADDRTVVSIQGKGLVAQVPERLRGLIEARGVGILRAPYAGPLPVCLVVDLDTPEPDRLPQWHEAEIMGRCLPCLFRIDGPHFPAAILQYLAHGREA